MIQNVLSRIGGVENYGIISICLFFATFLGMLFWSLRLKKTYLESMRELPLAEDCAVDATTEITPDPNTRHE
jgi:hypothetical protein